MPGPTDKLNKAETADVLSGLDETERGARRALATLKRKPRKGKTLEKLQLMEGIVQSCEALRLMSWR